MERMTEWRGEPRGVSPRVTARSRSARRHPGAYAPRLAISELDLAHLHLFIRLAQDHRVPFGGFLRRAGVAGDVDVDVRLAREQVAVGAIVVNDDPVFARLGLVDLIALG